MGAANPSACEPWATAADVCPPCELEGDDAIDADVMDDALQAATDILYALSGRQFAGLCTETLRPTVGCRCRFRRGWRERRIDSFYRRRCECLIESITLGVAPLVSIGQVLIDGEVLDPSAYRIDNDRELVRIDGSTWPTWQDLTLADDADGAFAVTVTYGIAPPDAGVRAAAALACQLALACTPGRTGECKLPKRVTSIDRQGLSMVVLDPFEFLDQGKTGVYEADLFIKAYNPHKLTTRPSVASPDIGPRARRVGT